MAALTADQTDTLNELLLRAAGIGPGAVRDERMLDALVGMIDKPDEFRKLIGGDTQPAEFSTDAQGREHKDTNPGRGQFTGNGGTDHGAKASKTITLYRASDDDIITDTASFSTTLDAAKAYLDNPGFGGGTLWKSEVEINPDELLDLYDMDEDEAIAKIRKLTGVGNPGAIGIDEWVPRIAEQLQDAGIIWVRVRESYPEGTETYIYLGGGDDPEMTEDDTDHDAATS